MSQDKGRELERRAHRLVWALGYFTRRNVFIYSDEGDQITDIDVIGIKFDETLTEKIMIVETKSEKGFLSLLKLRGLVEYYGADTSALIIRPNITPDVVRFADKLGIRAMHTSRLDEMETELSVSSKDWVSLPFSTEFDKRYLSSLKMLWAGGYKKENLIRDTFWVEDNPFYKVKLLKEVISNLKNSTPEDPSLRFPVAVLILDLTCLFSVSLLQSCGKLYPLPEHQRHTIFLDKLVSGRLSSREKQEFVDRTYTFITRYTKTILNAPLTIRKEDFALTPDYAEDLFFLVDRLIKKAPFSKEVPRLFDVYASIFTSEKRPMIMDLQGFLNLSNDEFQYCLKFARDIVSFLFGKEIPEFFKHLMYE